MTRNDYIGLAEAIARGLTQGDVLGSIKQWLVEDNNRFNGEVFDAHLARAMEKYINGSN